MTLLLRLGAGVAMTKVGSRYVFSDSTGKILLEADADEVDALRRLNSSKAAQASKYKKIKVNGNADEMWKINK